jgi:hypothetical protein
MLAAGMAALEWEAAIRSSRLKDLGGDAEGDVEVAGDRRSWNAVKGDRQVSQGEYEKAALRSACR